MLAAYRQACCNTQVITTSSVIKHFGSVAKVAEFFDIRVSAVYQWGRHIPRVRELELVIRKPSDFAAPRLPEKSAA